MRSIIVATSLMIVCFVMSSRAEMYRWEENGVVTFKDTPPPAAKKRKVRVYKDNDFAVPPPVPVSSKSSAKHTVTHAQPQQPEIKKAECFTGTIEMYSTEWCGYCVAAESYMKSRNYPYVKYDIEKDRAAKRRHKELGGRGVPLIIIGTNKMSGFSPDTMEYYLGKP